MIRDRLVSQEQMADRTHEQRKSERITIMAPVTIFTGDDDTAGIDGVTVNISAGGLLEQSDVEKHGTGGLLIETEEEIGVDQVCRIQLILPMPGFTGEFEIEGRILRHTPPASRFEKHRVAIQFSRILSHRFNNVKLELVKKMLGGK